MENEPLFPLKEIKRKGEHGYLHRDAAQTNARRGEELSDSLLSIASDISGIHVSLITPETTIGALGLDSLMRIGLTAQIEEIFGVELDEADILSDTRIKDIEMMIRRNVARKARYKLGSLPRSFFVRLLRRVVHRLFLFPLLAVFAKIEVRGVEVLGGLKGPVIFAANHQSDLDTPVVFRSLPPAWRNSLAVAAAADVLFDRFKILVPLVAFLFNIYPFPRQGQVKSALLHTSELLKKGWSVLIFPEGEISPTREMLPFKPGIGVLAVKTGLPVVPIKMKGAGEILPLRWQPFFYPRKLRGKVTVTFGKPLSFKKTTSYIEATNVIEKTIRNL